MAKFPWYELGGLDRLKNCGHGAFEDLSMIVHLVLTILSVLYDDVMTAQRGVARARDRKVGGKLSESPGPGKPPLNRLRV